MAWSMSRVSEPAASPHDAVRPHTQASCARGHGSAPRPHPLCWRDASSSPPTRPPLNLATLAHSSMVVKRSPSGGPNLAHHVHTPPRCLVPPTTTMLILPLQGLDEVLLSRCRATDSYEAPALMKARSVTSYGEHRAAVAPSGGTAHGVDPGTVGQADVYNAWARTRRPAGPPRAPSVDEHHGTGSARRTRSRCVLIRPFVLTPPFVVGVAHAHRRRRRRRTVPRAGDSRRGSPRASPPRSRAGA